MTLKDLKIGQTAVITQVGGEGSLRQHFLDMGVIPGAEVTLVKYAPMGDPMELLIHGYELTLRLADAEKIEIAGVYQVAEKPDKAESEDQQQSRKGEVKQAAKKPSIRVWARAANIMSKQMKIRCQRARS